MILYITERMAAELQRMLESDDEDEDYGEEESVFNTITIQQGYEFLLEFFIILVGSEMSVCGWGEGRIF
jgi:hypothetical protein